MGPALNIQVGGAPYVHCICQCPMLDTPELLLLLVFERYFLSVLNIIYNYVCVCARITSLRWLNKNLKGREKAFETCRG